MTPYFKKDNRKQNSHNLIIVEGQDDALLISSLLAEIKADPDLFGIIEAKGAANIQKELKNLLKSPGFTQGKNKSIAIICDADDDPRSVEHSLNKELISSGMPVLSLGQHIKHPDRASFGLFTMPDCMHSGDLEKLCLATVADTPMEKAAEAYICQAEKQAGENGQRLCGSRHKRKAQVFLAAEPTDLVRGAGQAYTKGFFNPMHSALEPLRCFLQEMQITGLSE